MLEAVAHLGPGTTAKEIATFAGVPSATAYRMLNLLVAEGFLVRVPDLSGFALGRRTAELSHAASSSGPAPTLHERVEDMRTHTRFGLHVASFAGGRLRFVDKDPDHEIIGIAALPKNLHANALGKVLLAHDERLLPGLDLRRVTEFTIGDFDILSEQLRVCSPAGICVRGSGVSPGSIRGRSTGSGSRGPGGRRVVRPGRERTSD